MSQISELISQGQAFHAGHFPANVTIAGQGYSCARNAFARQRDLITGGWLDLYKITFWIVLSKFSDAGQPVPRAQQFVQWEGRDLKIESAISDPTNTTLILRCESADQ